MAARRVSTESGTFPVVMLGPYSLDLRERLSKRGTSTSTSSVAQFFQRHRISCKKTTL
jgi:hypothetical protein